ncbi:MAG TPA: DUF3352 domain-containing protein [Candidatus Limnocylindrales bacterium]|nr:DUF3352 domain-containing protein [Candidatus Limnocylindrales bacterium]
MEPRPDDLTTSVPIDSVPATQPAPIPPPAVPADAAIEENGHAPTSTVAAGAPTPGSSRARWLVGGGVAVAAVAVIAIAAVMLGARPLPEVLKYVPADAAVVVELRPELPGDQRQQLGNFLAHFPGFDDQSILDDKIDEALERLFESGSSGLDYGTQVEPLLDGPMAVAVTGPGLEAMMGGASDGDGFLLAATTDGAATCESIFEATEVAATHRDVEIRTVAGEVACAIHDRYLLAGTVATVRAALDARLDNAGVDTNDRYTDARGRLEGDQLATAFVDGSAMAGVFDSTFEMFGQSMPELADDFWLIQGLRVEDDALVVDAYGPAMPSTTLPSGAPSTAPAAESRFAAVLPADTLGYVEVHGVGASVARAIAGMAADPDQAEALAQLQTAIAALGGAENLTGWIQELGLAVLPTDDGVGGVLLFRGTDAAAAEARVAQIRNLLVIASVGTDITVRDREHGDVTITTVDLGDLSSLLEGLGGLGGVPGAPTVPGLPDDELALEFELAVRGDLVVIGFGAGVVERVLDSSSSSSLATTGTYGRAVQLAGATNDMQVYLALDSAMGLVTTFLPADERTMFEEELEPYLEHVAGVALTSRTSSAGSHTRIVFTVK